MKFKFKEFKKAVNSNSDLLKLSGKELSTIFDIDVLKAKYFKKRFKQELEYAFGDYVPLTELPPKRRSVGCNVKTNNLNSPKEEKKIYWQNIADQLASEVGKFLILKTQPNV